MHGLTGTVASAFSVFALPHIVAVVACHGNETYRIALQRLSMARSLNQVVPPDAAMQSCPAAAALAASCTWAMGRVLVVTCYCCLTYKQAVNGLAAQTGIFWPQCSEAFYSRSFCKRDS